MEIKDRIKEVREKLKLTQQSFAEELNKIVITDNDPKIYAQTVSYWENGRDPSLNALMKMSELSGFSTDFFLGTLTEDTIPKRTYSNNLRMFSFENLTEKLSNYTDKSKNKVIDKINDYVTAIYWNDDSDDHDKFNNDDIARIFLYSNIVSALNEYLSNLKSLDKLSKLDLEDIKFKLEDSEYEIETPKFIADKLSRAFESKNKLQNSIELFEKWFTDKYRDFGGYTDLNDLINELPKTND